MVIQAKIIRDCALGPPGECQVEVGLVGVSSEELQDLEDQAEGHGLHFFHVAPEVELVEETPAGWESLGTGAVSEETPQELEDFTGLCCPLNDGPWKGSPCEEFTGWSEEEAVKELARLQLLLDIKRLQGGGF